MQFIGNAHVVKLKPSICICTYIHTRSHSQNNTCFYSTKHKRTYTDLHTVHTNAIVTITGPLIQLTVTVNLSLSSTVISYRRTSMSQFGCFSTAGYKVAQCVLFFGIYRVSNHECGFLQSLLDILEFHKLYHLFAHFHCSLHVTFKRVHQKMPCQQNLKMVGLCSRLSFYFIFYFLSWTICKSGKALALHLTYPAHYILLSLVCHL